MKDEPFVFDRTELTIAVQYRHGHRDRILSIWVVYIDGYKAKLWQTVQLNDELLPATQIRLVPLRNP